MKENKLLSFLKTISMATNTNATSTTPPPTTANFIITNKLSSLPSF